MLISVIIPNYNYAQYLEQCLQSLLESDVDKDKMEIIVVDDASTDNSVKVIEKIMLNSKFPFHLIKNETNLGLILSRNRGIAYAQGNFLFFLDSDNYINTECIKIHTNTLQQNPDATACYAPIQNFMNSTGEYCGLRSNQAFDYQKLLEGPYIDAMAMFRKNELNEVGKYDNKMPYYGWEDYELWLRLGKLNKKVIFVEGEPLSFYRVHELNKSQNYKDDQYNHLVYYLKQKYPIKLMLYQSDTLDSLIQKGYFAQLYFKIINSEYDEKQSVIKEITSGIKEISFKFDKSLFIKQLRFDPLNDYVCIRINTIQFINQGKPLDIEFKLSSNALFSENREYLFDTTDPQVFIDFPLEKSVELDEFIIDLEYLQKGYGITEQLLKHKNNEIETIKNKTLILNNLLQTADYKRDCLEQKLSENNITIQKQAEKIDLQSGLLNTLKTSNYEILKQYNNLEMQIGRLDSKLVNIKKSFSFKLFSLLNILLLVFNPLKFIGLIKRRLKSNRNSILIRQSDFFNTDYYLKNNPDVKQTEKSAIRHYLLYGGFEGRKPSEKFDSASYLAENPDIKENGINPLVHYLKYGSKEGRSMH
jgi:glycosyltransferase involved in cell wall biosynthesis